MTIMMMMSSDMRSVPDLKTTDRSRRTGSPRSVLLKRSTVDTCVSNRRPLTLTTMRRSHDADIRRPATESRRSVVGFPTLLHATQAVSSDTELSADLYCVHTRICMKNSQKAQMKARKIRGKVVLLPQSAVPL